MLCPIGQSNEKPPLQALAKWREYVTYFSHSYESGFVANAMAADAQEICEKYMKHLINTYFVPESEQEQNEFDTIMRTHNLMKLIRFLETNMDLHFPNGTKKDIQIINGYYFSAQYPGDESIEVTQEDLDLCAEAVKNCRTAIFEFIKRLEDSLSETIS